MAGNIKTLPNMKSKDKLYNRELMNQRFNLTPAFVTCNTKVAENLYLSVMVYSATAFISDRLSMFSKAIMTPSLC